MRAANRLRVWIRLAIWGWLGASGLQAEENWFLSLFSAELRETGRMRQRAERELEERGVPVVGQTTAQIGFQSLRRGEAGTDPAWVQIDLHESQTIDWVAVFPAQLDWQSYARPAYGFPQRFRIDLSEDPQFERFVTIADHTESDFPDPGLAPVSVGGAGQRARYVRVTVTKLAAENQQVFYALAELMVLSGNRNVAIGAAVSSSMSMELPPRWGQANLVDGWTPLGPPIRRELIAFDGLYAGENPDGSLPWMQIDLGRVYPLQEVRLHPVHARIGADIPGFAFPKRFRIEVSRSAEFSDPEVLWEAGGADYPNPGNNPLTIPGRGVEARFVRMSLLEPSAPMRRRFALSELEVYAEGRNVAKEGRVEATADSSSFSKNWPPSILNDGFTSYGRLMELPQWLQLWNERRQLRTELASIEERSKRLIEQAERRALMTGAGAGFVGLLALIGAWLVVQRRRRVELQNLRLRLARDLHDEIGSNLAGIAVLSEMAGENPTGSQEQSEDWREVNRVVRQSMEAMREVLWLMEAREEAGLELVVHLRSTAARMLADLDVVWLPGLELAPAHWSPATRRQFFLFFKEALTNLIRHAGATRVEILFAQADERVCLEIRDNGCGFDPKTVRAGIGLSSLKERARTLGADFILESESGVGTRIGLRVRL